MSGDFGVDEWAAYNICYNVFRFCAIWLPKPGICHGDNELRGPERLSREWSVVSSFKTKRSCGFTRKTRIELKSERQTRA